MDIATSSTIASLPAASPPAKPPASPLTYKAPDRSIDIPPDDNQIVLCTLNAKYIHASLGLRYLYANLGGLKKAARIREFTIAQRPIDIAEKLLALDPKIIGFGIYIWNVQQTETVISLIKKVNPEIAIVIGGPEVSYEYKDTPVLELCDYLITGQADFAFRDLCIDLLTGNLPTKNAASKVVDARPPSVNELVLPYDLYNANDLANRIVYVEASRGCPFKCEFCLSALDKTAYPFNLDNFLTALAVLYDRGARQFKFVDRTFNLKVASCIRILDFFLERLSDDLFLHFEVIPDKLPDTLKSKLTQFPELTLQFEIGVQSFNPLVQATINRKQDNLKTIENIGWLRQNTHAYIHADLIFGLPGETLESFGDGFNQLVALNPQEIQLGMLKRLRGTTIDRHTAEFQQCYASEPPYTLLKNRDIDFPTMQRMQRFARYWDMIGNSGRFSMTRPIILGDKPFKRFLQLSDWIFQSTEQTSRISLSRLFQLVYLGAAELNLCTLNKLVHCLEFDYSGTGEKGRPPWQDTARKNLSPGSGKSRRQAQTGWQQSVYSKAGTIADAKKYSKGSHDETVPQRVDLINFKFYTGKDVVFLLTATLQT